MPVYILIVEAIHEFVSDTIEGIYEYINNVSHITNIVDIEIAKNRLKQTDGTYCSLDIHKDEDDWDPMWPDYTYEVYQVKSDLA